MDPIESKNVEDNGGQDKQVKEGIGDHVEIPGHKKQDKSADFNQGTQSFCDQEKRIRQHSNDSVSGIQKNLLVAQQTLEQPRCHRFFDGRVP